MLTHFCYRIDGIWGAKEKKEKEEKKGNQRNLPRERKGRKMVIDREESFSFR